MKELNFAVILTLVSAAVFAGASNEQIALPWYPAKPITIIVPWDSESAIYEVTRAVADVLEGPLEQDIYLHRRPGVSGSTATAEALDANHDGYTWAAGSASDRLPDATWDDWAVFLHVADVSVVAVHSDAPYETYGDLIAAFKADPGTIIVAAPDTPSEGISYAPVTYDSVDEAVDAALNGEVEVVIQTAADLAAVLREGTLRALAVLSDRQLLLNRHGVIPPVTDWVDGFGATLSYYGIWTPADVPPQVLETFVYLWQNHIVTSETLAGYAAERGVLLDPRWGDEAKAKAMPHSRTQGDTAEP